MARRLVPRRGLTTATISPTMATTAKRLAKRGHSHPYNGYVAVIRW